MGEIGLKRRTGGREEGPVWKTHETDGVDHLKVVASSKSHHGVKSMEM